jgi:hypothetical protein
VAVEAAIILPMVIMLVFGMVEFSLMVRDWVAVTSATRSGARVASASADAGPGVCETGITAPTCTPATSPAVAQSAADAIQKALTGVPPTSINYILVYKANAAGLPGTSTSMPDACPVDCVKFVWISSQAKFRYAGGSWSSASINACVNEQDSVGIYLNSTHKMITGLFGSSQTVADRAVMRFEPLPTDSCKSTSPNHHA